MESENDQTQIHLDVVDQGEPPSADKRQDLMNFALPIVCIMDPVEVEDPSELSQLVLSELGLESSGGRRQQQQPQTREESEPILPQVDSLPVRILQY